MKIAVVGLGLIGGSFALECKKAGYQVVGIDTDVANLQEALELRLIDNVGSWEDLSSVALVVLAIPVKGIVKILPEVLDIVNTQTIVLDLGSTKKHICETVKNHPKRQHYIAAHPIAGTEFSGAKAAFLGLFNDKMMILCDIEQSDDKSVAIVEKMITDMGMNISYMNANEHDLHIAYVSHLSHISSFMLGKTVIEKERDETQIFNLAGSGFESTVRLAKSSPDTWVQIFEDNKSNIIDSLKEYIANLQKFKKLLEQDDYQSIHEQMERINKIKIILKGINN